MDGLTLFGVFSVTLTLLCYTLEKRSHWWILGFSIGCILSSIYGFLQGAWPFGIIEIFWAAASAWRWIGELRGLRARS
jgi:hypothetical protein